MLEYNHKCSIGISLSISFFEVKIFQLLDDILQCVLFQAVGNILKNGHIWLEAIWNTNRTGVRDWSLEGYQNQLPDSFDDHFQTQWHLSLRHVLV